METLPEKKFGMLLEEAEKLKQSQLSLKDLIGAIDNLIMSHAHSLPEKYEPQSIIESRFTLADEAFAKGMISCGATATISAEILRYIGYKVKFIHGESRDSVDHAWISVFDPEIKQWVEYDLTRDSAGIPDTHIKKMEVNSWEEIRGQIEDDHKTMTERRKQRGLL